MVNCYRSSTVPIFTVQKERLSQYPAAPGAVIPSLFNLNKTSLNRLKSEVTGPVLASILLCEFWSLTRSQMRSQVVPVDSAVVRAFCYSISCSLDEGTRLEKGKK